MARTNLFVKHYDFCRQGLKRYTDGARLVAFYRMLYRDKLRYVEAEPESS